MLGGLLERRGGRCHPRGVTILLMLMAVVGVSFDGSAAKEYMIDTLDISSTGLYVTITGTGHGYDTISLPKLHNVTMNWGDGTEYVYDSPQFPTYGKAQTFYYDHGEADQDVVTWHWDDWNGDGDNTDDYKVWFSVHHTYSPTVWDLQDGFIGQGHSQSVGQESDLSTFFLQIDFLDVLQDGLPADTDGTFHISGGNIGAGPLAGGDYYYNERFAVLTQLPDAGSPTMPTITVNGEDAPSVGGTAYELLHWGQSWAGGTFADPMSFTLQEGGTEATAYYQPSCVPPTANADLYATCYEETLVISAAGVLTNDDAGSGTSLTAVKLTDPSDGTLTAFGSDGSFTYVPDSSFSGSDSFTYKANNGCADSDPATVTISVGSEIVPVISIQSIDHCTGAVTLSVSTTGGSLGYSSYVWAGLPTGMIGSGSTASGTVAPGTYTGITVTVTDGLQCTGTSAPFGFTMNELPVVTIQVDDGELNCNNPSALLSVLSLTGGETPIGYQWYTQGHLRADRRSVERRRAATRRALRMTTT